MAEGAFRRVLWLLIAVMAAAAPAAAAGTAKQGLSVLAGSIEAPPVLRAEFRQTRRSRALSRPIISSGRLVAASRNGILWQLEDPFPLTVVMTPTRLIEREQGSAPRVMPLSSQPNFQAFMRLFIDLPAGRLQSLSDSFETAVKRNGQAWQLKLTPKDRMLASAISAIDVQGRNYIDTVVVHERGGDTTTVSFFAQRPDPAGLTAAEARSFRE